MLALALGCSGTVPVGIAPPPRLEDPDRIRFVAIGDSGKGDAGQQRVAAGIARACAERGCDLVILLGDNLYPRGMTSADDPRADAWIREMYRGTDAPLYLVLGNHDYAHGRDRVAAARQIAWAERTDGVELPANAWTADADFVRIVALDTNAAFQFGGAFQGRWLRAQLDASDAVWNVVLGHHPYLSDGQHGNAGRYEGIPWVPWMSGTGLRTLFDETLCGRADLYLSGHDHTRQLLDACEGALPLVVSGGGASSTQLVDRGNRPRFARASIGSAWLELGRDGLGRVVFLDADGVEEETFALSSAEP